MEINLRIGTPEDAEPCGAICYDAFRTVAAEHDFPPDFDSAESAIKTLTLMFQSPGFYGVVAEVDGDIVGSNFLDERDAVAGLGPITVDPNGQNSGVGRALMLHMLERAEETGRASVRLFQSAYHNRSLSLYAKLGFVVREPLSVMIGDAVHIDIPGRTVRPATEDDADACNAVCKRVHRFERAGEVRDAIQWGHPLLVEHDGRVTGYATTIGSAGHAVGDSNEDIMALIGAGRAPRGTGVMVPSRNAELFKWCLDQGLRVSIPGTLMSTGTYHDPKGAFLPSSLY